jgi:hypothetical protein
MFKFLKNELFKKYFEKSISCKHINNTPISFTYQKFWFSKKTHKNTKHSKSNNKKRNKESSSENSSGDELDHLEKHDKSFEEYLKKEEEDKKLKEMEKEMRRKYKEEEAVKCLVLHPIFEDKY